MYVATFNHQMTVDDKTAQCCRPLKFFN